MKNSTMAILLGSLLVMTGCATQTAHLKSNAVNPIAKAETHKFYLSGIGQEQTVDASRVCGGAHRVAKVESKLDTKDVLLGVVTLGIYTPRTATVYCQ